MEARCQCTRLAGFTLKQVANGAIALLATPTDQAFWQLSRQNVGFCDKGIDPTAPGNSSQTLPLERR